MPSGQSAMVTTTLVGRHERRHRLAEHDWLGGAGALGLRLGDKARRSEDRPEVQEPLLCQPANGNADPAVGAPRGAARFLNRELGQCPEERQLVAGHLLVPVQDAFDLVHGAKRSRGPQFEQEGVPARACASECVFAIPPADLLEAHSLKQELQVLGRIVREEAAVDATLVSIDIAARQRQRKQQASVWTKQLAQCKDRVE
jgi:hypothetical protein